MNNRASIGDFKRISLGDEGHSHSFSGRLLTRRAAGNDIVEAYVTPTTAIALVVFSAKHGSPEMRFALYRNIAELRSKTSLPDTVFKSITKAALKVTMTSR